MKLSLVLAWLALIGCKKEDAVLNAQAILAEGTDGASGTDGKDGAITNTTTTVIKDLDCKANPDDCKELLPLDSERPLFALGVAANSVVLKWGAGNAAVDHYVVAYAEGETPPADCKTGSLIKNIDKLTWIVGGEDPNNQLKKSTTYSFRVCGVDAKDPPNMTVGLTATTVTDDATIPPDPTGVYIQSTSANTITVAWRDVGLQAKAYRVAYNVGGTVPADGCSSGTILADTELLQATITGLNPNTYATIAVCTVGYVDDLVSLGAIIVDKTGVSAPAAPTNFVVTTRNADSLLLTWGLLSTHAAYQLSYVTGSTAPADCNTGTKISLSLDVDADSSASTFSYQVNGLAAATTYSFLVCALNANRTPDLGTGTSLSATTRFAQPPSPINVTVTPSATSAVVYFESGGGSTTQYIVGKYIAGTTTASAWRTSYCTTGTKITGTAVGGGSSLLYANVTGLSANNVYTFVVLPVNAESTTTISDCGTATTVDGYAPASVRSASVTVSPVSISGGSAIAQIVYAAANISTGTLPTNGLLLYGTSSVTSCTQSGTQSVTSSTITFSTSGPTGAMRSASFNMTIPSGALTASTTYYYAYCGYLSTTISGTTYTSYATPVTGSFVYDPTLNYPTVATAAGGGWDYGLNITLNAALVTGTSLVGTYSSSSTPADCVVNTGAGIQSFTISGSAGAYTSTTLTSCIGTIYVRICSYRSADGAYGASSATFSVNTGSGTPGFDCAM